MLSESKVSCFIDGSHISYVDFSIRVIDYAISRGFEIDEEQYRADIWWLDSEEDDEEKLLAIRDALDWAGSDAIDYLNDIDIPTGRGWWVEDNSLFMEDLDD